MAHDFPDDPLQAVHFEAVDSFFHDGVAWPLQLSYAEGSPPYTHDYAENNNLLPSQHYDHHTQETWDPNAYHSSIPSVLAPSPNDSLTDSIHTNDSPYGYGQGNTTDISWIDLHRPSSNGYLGEHLSPPGVHASYESAYAGSSTEELTPGSSLNEPDQEESTIRPIRCKWQGCTNSNLFGRDKPLWQHIKEEHILPGVFKCSAPACEMVFDRLKKLNGHSRVHGDNKGHHGKQAATHLLQCGWHACNNHGFFGSHYTLQRHIKEKHSLPGVYKCPAPGCEKKFGRLDKLSEHLKTHSNDEE